VRYKERLKLYKILVLLGFLIGIFFLFVASVVNLPDERFCLCRSCPGVLSRTATKSLPNPAVQAARY